MFEFKEFSARITRSLSPEIKGLLINGGVRQAQACQCHQDKSAQFSRDYVLSCQCTATKILGRMYWAGLTYDEARRQCLDARHRGMDAITRSDADPRIEFNALWDYVRETTTDAMPPVTRPERTLEDRQTLFIGLVGEMPGITSSDLRKALPLRHNVVADLRSWALDDGYVRTETVGRKVLHYRTNKVYEPLDRYVTLEDFRLWAPRMEQCEKLPEYLDSDNEQARSILQAFVQKRRDYSVEHGEHMRSSDFIQCYGLTTQEHWGNLVALFQK